MDFEDSQAYMAEESGADGAGFTLQDLWAIVQMQRGVIALGTIGCLMLAAAYTATATRFYSANAVVHVSTVDNQEMEMGETVSNEAMIWNRELYVRTTVALVNMRSFRSKVLERYAETWPDEGIGPGQKGLEAHRASVSVKPRKGTELLDISVVSSDPDFSARIANLTAQVLENQRLEHYTEAASNAKAWLETQLSDQELKLASAAEDVLDYQRTHDMADAQSEQTTLGAQMTQLNTAFGEANSERVVFETTLQMREGLLNKKRYNELAQSMDSPIVMELHKDYVEARYQRELMETKYGEKWPGMREAGERVTRTQTLLEQEIRRSLKADRAVLGILQAKEDNLAREIGGGKEQLLAVLGRSGTFERKLLELETIKDSYKQMRQRYGELELQSKTQLNNVRVVDPARRASSPTSPKVSYNMTLGLAGGLILGLAGAFLREWLDDSINSPLDVSTYLKVPLLGSVPKIDELDPAASEVDRSLHTHFSPRSQVAEAVRSLRTVIELNPRIAAPRRILVTSAMSSEGKTSTAMRLAIAFANVGRKVVLIDCDLRRPRVHKVFGHDRGPGFSECIYGDVSLDEIVRPTDVQSLSYISAGCANDRPNEALANPQTIRLIEELENDFDLVIIDSPPSVSISDSRILSRYVDGVIVVVKERATSRRVVRETVQSMQQVGGNVLGVVINEVDLNRQQSYYYYGYQYRYYDYGDDQAAAK